jgi:predicted transcriptional regulator
MINKLTKNDEKLLHQMKKWSKGSFGSSTILTEAKILGISERTAYRSINRLTQAGKLTSKTIYSIK